MLKKQPYSAYFFHIMYIDVIHNVIHNTYMHGSFILYTQLLVYILYTPKT
jgi:hypothetical protein